MSFFSIKQLNTGYPKAFHLQDVSFGIQKGVFAGVIGPNGSGKSTLLKSIVGELKLPQNHVFLDAKDLSKLSDRERARNIAVVSQFNTPVDISVQDYVLLGRLPYKSKFQFFEIEEDYTIANKFMTLTGVEHLKDKHFSHLSGGEQQLVSLAKALTQEPKLLLLDEPTSHLDISHQVQVLNLIQRLSMSLNLTVLMIIHDLNLASEYCDHLIMMKNGRVYGEGLPQDVLNYQTVEEVFDTVVFTQENPMSKKPTIYLVSEKVLEQTRRQEKNKSKNIVN